MPQHPLKFLKVESFGPLETVKVEWSPQLNVITGDNATGKSQLLKLMYASTRAVSGEAVPVKSDMERVIARKLLGVFKPDSLGRLTRRVRGRARAEIELKFEQIGSELRYSFASNARTDVKIMDLPRAGIAEQSVFLPSRELLSVYPGLVALYENREVEFDETWRDTAALLGQPAARGPRLERANELLRPLLTILEGTVVEENGRFSVRTSGASAGKIEAHLVSEGYRKLAMLVRLVTSGVLLEDGYLFWDEPEANLNPQTQRAVALAILILARSGTQVFVATHSVFLLRELELLLSGEAELDDDNANEISGVSAQFVALKRVEDGGVMSETAALPSELSFVAAMEAEFDQSLRVLGV